MSAHVRPGPAMVVVGAVNVDLVVAAARLPGPGETVVGADLERFGGGKGANAAVAAARAGAVVRLVGAVGRDDHGAAALEELRSEGVDVRDVEELADRPTGVALIVVDAQGENQIAVGAGANGAVRADHVRDALRDALSTAGCVLVSTEIPGDAVVAALDAATAAGVPCVLNPAPMIPAVLDALDRGPVLTPNATELLDVTASLDGGGGDAGNKPATPAPGDREWVLAPARRVAHITGAPVVVTLGGDGAMVVMPDGEADHLPPHPTDVRDATGAGDTFNGVLAARLASGEPLGSAARFAVAAASLSVRGVGARGGMPDAAAIEAASAPG